MVVSVWCETVAVGFPLVWRLKRFLFIPAAYDATAGDAGMLVLLLVLVLLLLFLSHLALFAGRYWKCALCGHMSRFPAQDANRYRKNNVFEALPELAQEVR